jgi:DNA helicase-2/ATP-dependent DNA helicase PcrA
MLDAVIQKRLRPEVRVAFVDEAQDLSPLQAAVVEMWFRDCDRVYVAGDDDQAIFGFQGADPGWIMSIASRGAVVETLGRSYRLPRRIHGLAQSIIRQNRQRVDKSYEPRPEDGEVLELPADDVLDAVADAPSVLILARNKSFLQPWVARLLERTEPFTAEGRLAGVPLDTPGIVAAVTAGLRLQRGDPIPAADLNAMLQLVPAQGAVPLPRGTKARAARRQGGLARDELARSWGLGGFLGRLDAVGPAGVLVRLPTDQRLYLARLLDRFGDLPMPRIRLLTIHGAKGREADSVVVIPDMSRAAYETLTNAGREGEEAENRVAYVAVTRAKRRLILIEPSTQRFYPYGDMSLQTGVGVSR